MNKCACGCGVSVTGKWSKGHNRKGISPTNKSGDAVVDACGTGGYLWVYKPKHPHARKNGYVKRCRLVLEQQLGRFLRPDEDAHHKNGVKTDDRPDNLEVLTHGNHAKLHVMVADVCRLCGGPHRARGLCASCYGKYYRLGISMPFAPSRGSRWSATWPD